MFVGALRRRRDQRLADPLCQFHADCRDAGHVYRPAGLSFLLRDDPGRLYQQRRRRWSSPGSSVLSRSAFIVLVVLAVGGEYAAAPDSGPAGGCGPPARMRNLRAGSAFGSIAPSSPAISACSLLTALGAIMLMAQIGVGDPRQGINYTLSSITAVVLGGTSLAAGAAPSSARFWVPSC